MFDFHEDNGEVVNEEHRVHHAIGIGNQIFILDSSPLLVENANAIKEPKGKDEDEE